MTEKIDQLSVLFKAVKTNLTLRGEVLKAKDLHELITILNSHGFSISKSALRKHQATRVLAMSEAELEAFDWAGADTLETCPSLDFRRVDDNESTYWMVECPCEEKDRRGYRMNLVS